MCRTLTELSPFLAIAWMAALVNVSARNSPSESATTRSSTSYRIAPPNVVAESNPSRTVENHRCLSAGSA